MSGRPQFSGVSQIDKNQNEVERPSDRASRSGDVKSEFGSASILDGNSANVLTFTNNTGVRRQVQFISIAPGDGSDAVARADLQIKDGSGNIVHEIIGTVRQYPYILSPTLPLQDGWQVNIKVHNNDGVEKQYIAAALHRGE